MCLSQCGHSVHWTQSPDKDSFHGNVIKLELQEPMAFLLYILQVPYQVLYCKIVCFEICSSFLTVPPKPSSSIDIYNIANNIFF